jgi:formylmethanofuran dehydrogenase subunit E
MDKHFRVDSLEMATMKTTTSPKKIKCNGCNDWREDIYYTLQDGPLCTDCLKKKYREFFRKESEPNQK